MVSRLRVAFLVVAISLLAACVSPLYVWDTHTTSTPRPRGLELAEVRARPVAVLPLVAPAALQGFSASLSHALIRTLPELSPPLRGLATQDVVNAVNAGGFAAEYADLLAGFGRSGILERERLGRLGVTLDCRYAFLPGITAFDHSLLDRFEMAGLKIVRTRVLVLRLWLQLWDTGTGQLVWESAGEAAVAGELANTGRVIPVDEVAEKIWKRMLEDGLLAGKLSSRAPTPRDLLHVAVYRQVGSGLPRTTETRARRGPQRTRDPRDEEPRGAGRGAARGGECGDEVLT